MTKVFSLGGSLVAPGDIDIDFLKKFKEIALSFLQRDSDNRLILVIGGGAPARIYQQAARSLDSSISNDELDWIGIAATRLNAQLVKAFFGELAPCPVADNPETACFDKGRILVACGWKPGFSSDFDAVVLGHRFNSTQVVNLSNIDYVYTADPRKDPKAQKIESISWANFRQMIGDEWNPGANLPFDPIAAKLAMEHQLQVIVAKGSNLGNLSAIFLDEPYIGTTIG